MEPNLKKEAALGAFPMIRKGMTIGLGAGATIAYLVEAIAADPELAASLTLLSSSAETIVLLKKNGLEVVDAGELAKIDLYFDGCDQVDANLNALKSGAGIHAIEKVLASMANEFIILADAAKFTDKLNAVHPLVLEVLPPAIKKIISAVEERFPGVVVSVRKKGNDPVLTERKNLLIDLRFEILPVLDELNRLKMLPGVVDHSLFLGMAKGAVIAGKERVISLRV